MTNTEDDSNGYGNDNTEMGSHQIQLLMHTSNMSYTFNG